jgi:hypothetical protein
VHPHQNLEDENILDTIAAEILRNAQGNARVKILDPAQLWACQHLKIPTLETHADLREYLRNPENKKKCRHFENPEKLDWEFLSDLMEERGLNGPLILTKREQQNP